MQNGVLNKTCRPVKEGVTTYRNANISGQRAKKGGFNLCQVGVLTFYNARYSQVQLNFMASSELLRKGIQTDYYCCRQRNQYKLFRWCAQVPESKLLP
ncbi:MAG TPA: hypothetical protein DCS23_00655 [Candidatus Yonathbacteria bacterium]|nr:hypothetical protein [Candidatus Yonathbacteria bacterium]